MNIMNMPGFTAETSLYKTRGHYRAMAGTPNALGGGRGVLPQLPTGFCMADCDFTESDSFLRDVCKLRCLGDDGGGGGGGGGGRGGGGDHLTGAACRRAVRICHLGCRGRSDCEADCSDVC